MQGENERQFAKMRKHGDPGIFVPWGFNLTTLLIEPDNLCPSTPYTLVSTTQTFAFMHSTRDTLLLLVKIL